MGIDFERAKAIDCREAARRLGLEPNRAGKLRCFLHTGDNTPSLQLYPDHWKCYGCGEHGDVIDLVARYRNMKPGEAAQWLLGESPAPPKPKTSTAQDYGTFEHEYVYPDKQRKKIIYRRRDGSKNVSWKHLDNGRWVKNRGDAPPSLYEAGKWYNGEPVCVAEGEKDAETLKKLMGYGVSGEHGAGHGKWRPEYTEQLRGKTVWIFGDNDEVGRDYAQETAAALYGAAESVKVLDLKTVWPEIPEKGDISDMVAALGAEETGKRIAALEQQTPEWIPDAPAFAPFVPLCPETEIPPFPVSCMGPVRGYIESVAASYQVDPGMVAGCVIGTLGTCNQGKYAVHEGGSWYEPLSIFHLTVADSGENKTQVLRECFETPVTGYEKESNQRFAPVMDDWNTDRDILQGKIEEELKKLKRGKGNRDALRDLQAQMRELESEKVTPLRLTTGDATPQKLEQLMADYGGRMTIYTDEADGMFDMIAGKYSSQSADTGTYCKGYSGSRIITDRIGREPVAIEHPALSINAAIQPGLLEKHMGNKIFRYSGLMARFLYTFPPSMLPFQTPDSPPVNPDFKQDYQDAIDSLLSRNPVEQAILELSPEAKAAFNAYYLEIRDSMVDGVLETMRDYGNKVRGNCLRIAGNLHLLEYARQDSPETYAISGETMRAAIELSRYYVSAAIRAYQGGPSQAEQNALYIWKRIKKSGKAALSKRDLNRLCKRFQKAEDMDAGLSVLEEHGYISTETNPTKGRPAVTIYPNPKALS